jgi:hypothetical protein
MYLLEHFVNVDLVRFKAFFLHLPSLSTRPTYFFLIVDNDLRFLRPTVAIGILTFDVAYMALGVRDESAQDQIPLPVYRQCQWLVFDEPLLRSCADRER